MKHWKTNRLQKQTHPSVLKPSPRSRIIDVEQRWPIKKPAPNAIAAAQARFVQLLASRIADTYLRGR